MYIWYVDYCINIEAPIAYMYMYIHIQWNSCLMTYNLLAQQDTSEIERFILDFKMFRSSALTTTSLSLSLFLNLFFDLGLQYFDNHYFLIF